VKHETKILLGKACDSLILSIEFFNRPHEIGRVTTTLILLDHAFEMLLKASILQRGGPIREKGENQTIGFDKCVRTCLSNGKVKFINEEQALIMQGINILRDAAQHHILYVSENQFYMQVQSGLTLFRDLIKYVFNKDLYELLPSRVLPISTTSPVDIDILFDNEIREVLNLLRPGSRKTLEAHAKLRPLVILDRSIRGRRGQPSDRNLTMISKKLMYGKKWQDVFPGVSSIEISSSGTGQSLAIRWTKKEGVPIHTVPEGTPGAAVVAIKRVSELGFYNLSTRKVAEMVGLTLPKTVAIIRYLKLQDNEDYFKVIEIDKSIFKRYSQKAVQRISEELPKVSLDKIWEDYGPKKSKGKQ
jgi:hypothetical protein